MSQRKIPPYIKPAGILRNSVGFFIDAFFFLLFGTILYISIGRPVVYRNWLQGDAHYAKYEELALQSGFSYVDENDEAVDYVPNSELSGKEYYLQYVDVEALVWNYYYNVIPSNPNFVFMEEDHFSSSYEEGTAGYLQDVGKWIYESVFSVFDEDANSFWAVPESDFAYNVMPSLNEETSNKINDPDLDIATAKAKDVFISLYTRGEGSTAIYQTAQNHLLSQPTVKAESDGYKNATLAAFAPSILVAPILSYLIPSVLFKDGRSIGKKIMKVAVISSSGYKCSRPTLLLRGVLLCLPFWMNLIPHPFVTLPISMLVFMIDYMVLVMNKNHQSLHDLACRTITIRSDLSLWFASAEVEERYIESHPSSLPAKWRNGELKPGGRKLVGGVVATKEDYGIFDSSFLNEKPKEDPKEGETSEDSGEERFTDETK